MIPQRYKKKGYPVCFIPLFRCFPTCQRTRKLILPPYGGELERGFLSYLSAISRVYAYSLKRPSGERFPGVSEPCPLSINTFMSFQFLGLNLGLYVLLLASFHLNVYSVVVNSWLPPLPQSLTVILSIITLFSPMTVTS